MNRAMTVGFWMLRALLVLQLGFLLPERPGDLVIWSVVLSEMVALVLGAHNLGRSTTRDETFVGIGVLSMAYASRLLYAPTEETTHLVSVASIVLAVVITAVRLNLGWSYSMGPATYVKLQRSGAYAWVRHPLWSLALCSGLVTLIAWPSGRNVLVFAVQGWFTVWAIFLEESFLRRSTPAYSTYVSEVPYRLIRGVW
jgi:protein-S-isoprenylcysteine O-methyltransferase Ste14